MRVSTSKDVDAALSENKATSVSVASPRANGRRSLRAEEERDLDDPDEDRALLGSVAESALARRFAQLPVVEREYFASSLLRNVQSLPMDIQVKFMDLGHMALWENKIKTIVREGRLTENEGFVLLQGMKFVTQQISSFERNQERWVEAMILLMRSRFLSQRQLKRAFEIAFDRKYAVSRKKLKWTQLKAAKKKSDKPSPSNHEHAE